MLTEKSLKTKLELNMKASLVEVDVLDIQKRRIPSKHYVSIFMLMRFQMLIELKVYNCNSQIKIF